MDTGVSTEMIKYLCEQRKISLYAYDGKQNCFEKMSSKAAIDHSGNVVQKRVSEGI